MALVALTDEQKIELSKNDRYRPLVYWAVVDEATYWSQQDGISIPDPELPKWAKSRYMGVNHIIYRMQVGEEYYNLFLALLNMPVYDNINPFDSDVVLDYMVSSGTFDVLASLAFDSKIKEILF